MTSPRHIATRGRESPLPDWMAYSSVTSSGTSPRSIAANSRSPLRGTIGGVTRLLGRGSAHAAACGGARSGSARLRAHCPLLRHRASELSTSTGSLTLANATSRRRAAGGYRRSSRRRRRPRQSERRRNSTKPAETAPLPVAVDERRVRRPVRRTRPGSRSHRPGRFLSIINVSVKGWPRLPQLIARCTRRWRVQS